jgi:hypothetical protein
MRSDCLRLQADLGVLRYGVAGWVPQCLSVVESNLDQELVNSTMTQGVHMADRGGTRFDELPAVVADVAQRAGVDDRYAESVLGDLHHVIDRLVADDCSLLLGPLYLTMRGDPVLERILERFTDDDWANPFGVKVAEFGDLARYLGLPAEEVAIRPPAFGATVLLELADWRAVEEDDETELRRLDSVIWLFPDEGVVGRFRGVGASVAG